MQELARQAAAFIRDSQIEFAATVFSLIYIVLSLKQHISMWLFGLLSSLLYIYVFYAAKFYADASLMIYYVVVSIIGWLTWRKKAKSADKLEISLTDLKLWFLMGLISVMVFTLYAFILHNTDSNVPYADAATTSLSITATWMLARKKMEHWLIWIVVDFFAAGLYLYKDLYFTSFLYLIYGILAVIGFFRWRTDFFKQKTIKVSN